MGRRNIDRTFGRLLQALGNSRPSRFDLDDLIRPVAHMFDFRHMERPVHAHVCYGHILEPAGAGTRAHVWIGRETADAIIPLYLDVLGAVQTDLYLTGPGTTLDGDVATQTVTPQSNEGTSFAPLSRMHSRGSTVVPAAGVHGYNSQRGTGTATQFNLWEMFGGHYGRIQEGGLPGAIAQFHTIAVAANVDLWVSYSWLEISP